MDNTPLTVSFLNVGHGDSIVLILPNANSTEKTAFVIDCPDGEKTFGFLKQNHVTQINTIFITHPDSDHYLGISTLISNFLKIGKINSICFNMVKEPIGTDGKYKQLLRQLANYNYSLGIKLIPGFIQEDCINRVFEDCNITIQYPSYTELTKAISNSNTNNMSIVLKITYCGHTILLPGDLDHDGWLLLSNRLNPNICNVLKLPHHGDYYDKKLTTEEIIDYTRPSITIVSTAENEKYNHPNIETIKLLKNKDIHVLCTQTTKICNSKCSTEHCPCANDITISIDKTQMQITPDFDTIYSIKASFENAQCIKKL